jgi:GTP-binding protein
MEIKSAQFVISNTKIERCPKPVLPEYAFIGRSNVGKSSLINVLTGKKKLAKTSAKPGKTQLINHFIINDEWYLVDLPGYGYAKTSKKNREQWERFIHQYLLKRESLMCVMVLLDARIPPQKIDLEFMKFLGINGVPFVMVFTKIDGVTKSKRGAVPEVYKKEMLKEWEEIPKVFVTSSTTAQGKEDILQYIETLNPLFAANEQLLNGKR